MTIREAGPEDAHDMARVRVDTWRAAYRGIVPDGYLDSLSYEAFENLLSAILWKGNQAPFAFVAENSDGQVVGVAMAGPVLDGQEEEYKGEIYVLYVLPDQQEQGYGRQLAQACALRLVEQSLTPIMLWTLALGPARAFYEKLGGRVVREKEEVYDGKLLTEVGYGWIDPEPLCGK